MAPFDFLDKFRSFILLEAIIPVSEPEENAEKISSTNSAASKKDIELVPKELLKVVCYKNRINRISKNHHSKG